MTGETKHPHLKDQLESKIADMERVALQGTPGGQGWHMRGDQSRSVEVTLADDSRTQS